MKIEDDGHTGLHLMHPVLRSVSLPRQSVTHARHIYSVSLSEYKLKKRFSNAEKLFKKLGTHLVV